MKSIETLELKAVMGVDDQHVRQPTTYKVILTLKEENYPAITTTFEFADFKGALQAYINRLK